MTTATRAAVTLAMTVGLMPSSSLPAGAVPGLELRYGCELEARRLADVITVTFRVRTDQAGDEWRIRLFHEGSPVFRTVRRTNVEGNLKVARVVPNLPGRDDLEARARHLETRELCAVGLRA
jgi:hypothetical protein